MKSLILFLAVFSLWACSSQNEGDVLSSAGEKTTLQLAMQYTETSRFDSLVLHGEGADTIHLQIQEPEKALELELFPALWKFYANLYANGMLMQKGESEIEIESGQKNFLQIPLKALFGFVDVSLPLGLNNPAKIESGTLELKTNDTTYAYDMKIELPYGKFATDALPLDKTYNVLLKLFDSDGECIFMAEDTLVLNLENAVQEWELESLKGTLSVTFVTDLLQTQSIQASLPKGHKRTPKVREILISEILPIPEQTGTDFEFVEFYNGTNDSLVLENCVLFGGTPKSASIPDGIILPPNSYKAIGADSAIGVDLHTLTKWPSLTNTKQSIVLECDGITIDSVFYGQKDSLITDFIPVKSAVSTQLVLNKWKEKESGSAWCLAEPSPGIQNKCE